MKRLMIPALMTLIGTGSSLMAQEPRLGLSLNLVLPTGQFQSRSGTGLDNANNIYNYTEGYDFGFGGQVTFSFPVDPKLAFRVNLGAQSTDGSNTAPGYSKINLRHVMFSVGGDLQIFTQSAYRHRGTYFLVGLAADFERFDRSFDDLNSDWASVDSTRKSRLGGNFGIGHTFGYNAGTRFTLEATYHKSLTGIDTAKGDPTPADFVRVGFGWVF
ncbi:MAG: hypothetical protein IPN59_16740 [Holophaga sp.]|nr:hypothetical protein [Holophaga sp.]